MAHPGLGTGAGPRLDCGSPHTACRGLIWREPPAQTPRGGETGTGNFDLRPIKEQRGFLQQEAHRSNPPPGVSASRILVARDKGASWVSGQRQDKAGCSWLQVTEAWLRVWHVPARGSGTSRGGWTSGLASPLSRRCHQHPQCSLTLPCHRQ